MRDYKQFYQHWCESDAVDAATRAELVAIANDEAEITDRFYCDMAFGTAGMRGVLGAGTNRMNRYTVRKATEGYARYLAKYVGDEAKRRGVVIAHDNRRMSREFCMETACVLAANGIKAYIFDALRPTPELSFAVRYCGAIGGVMITASHNPPEYNGYKLYDEQGCQLMPRYTDVLTGIINAIEDPLTISTISVEEAGDLICMLDSKVDEAYYDAVMGIRLRKDVDAANLSVIYSPQHGTGNVPVRTVLDRCGYNLIPVLEQCTPDGDFSATKSPNPENAVAYELALDYAAKNRADIVITTDPDCDRLGVAALKNGKYELMTGNQSGALLLHYILSYRREKGTIPAGAVMCNTIVTSVLGDRVCEHFGVDVEKTLTGFKFIGDKIHTWEQDGKRNYVFGYEESYGCLIEGFARDKDAVQASLMLCEAAAHYKTEGKTLWDVMEECYATYGYCLDKVVSVEHKGATGVAKIASLLEALRKNPPSEVGGVAVVDVEDYLDERMISRGFPASNVLRYIFADGSFVAVRPSGTEPKCKYYYCVMATSKDEAESKLAALRASFEE